MSEDPSKPSSSIWDRLPSIVWIFIIIGGLAALIGGIIGIFYALSTLEGVASFVMLAVAWLALRAEARVSDHPKSAKTPAWITAIGITFFALMGMAIDQAGNYFYNMPMDVLFCPDNTSLGRSVDVSNPLPGRTDVSQRFTCYTDEGGREVKTLGALEIVSVRFVEYVIIGYALMFLSRLYSRLKRLRARPASSG